MDEQLICPGCGGDLEHWNMGIWECPDCDLMFDEEVLKEAGI